MGGGRSRVCNAFPEKAGKGKKSNPCVCGQMKKGFKLLEKKRQKKSVGWKRSEVTNCFSETQRDVE